MHFSGVCGVPDPQDVYSLMGPYQEGENDYDCDDYDPFWDWYEIGGRRAGVIKLKKGCKGYTDIDWYDGDDFRDQEAGLKKGSCSIAKKKDIDYFYKGKTNKDKYPQTRMFFNDDGDPVFQPEELKRDREKQIIVKRENFEEDLKGYYEKLEAWYDHLPDDYYIVIIDYHD